MYLYKRIKHYSIPESHQNFSGVTPKIVLVFKNASPESHAFLSKMITGFKWSPEDLFYLELNDSSTESCADLWAKASIELIWLFDLSPAQVGLFIEIPKYQLVPVGRFKVYFSDGLDHLDSNKQIKLRVWNDIKSIIFE